MHKPVLLQEVLTYLNPQPGHNFIDCTFGGGGYSQEILKKIGPTGKLLALDVSPEAAKIAQTIKNKNFLFINDNFLFLSDLIHEHFPYPINGFVFDLGLSTNQLELSGRGFSFQKDEPLDMRFDIRTTETAAQIINTYSLADLIYIFKTYGEYQYARQLAIKIVNARRQQKITTTAELVALADLVHTRRYWEKIHPATKIFQALRIAVNHELDNFSQALAQTEEILASSGRVVTVCFHALEDRIAKNYFRTGSRGDHQKWRLLTKKPIVPSENEIRKNPRSRSAKLRAAEKI